LKAAPGFCKAVMVLLIGGIAGEEHCKGREMLGYILLGCGLLVSMGGLCRDKTKKG
jgi:EamA domain-containing membrane protein RarD